MIAGAALTLAVLPTISLLSWTVVSAGKFVVNCNEVSLGTDPQQYWFTMGIEVAVVVRLLVLSIIKFPYLE